MFLKTSGCDHAKLREKANVTYKSILILLFVQLNISGKFNIKNIFFVISDFFFFLFTPRGSSLNGNSLL